MVSVASRSAKSRRSGRERKRGDRGNITPTCKRKCLGKPESKCNMKCVSAAVVKINNIILILVQVYLLPP